MIEGAIINPVWKKGMPELGPVAVMAATRHGLGCLRRTLDLDGVRGRDLFMSRLFVGQEAQGVSLVGPLIGAPYAAMLLETLIAGGARKIIFLGWCGAVSPSLKIGDIVVPSAAKIDEGTSCHYRADSAMVATPSSEITKKIKEALTRYRLDFHEGSVWTTDAVFRETRAKVEQFQSRGALAVEMETSALFTVGKFRAVKVGALLVVSDELAAFSWKPGFKDQRFKQNRRQACHVIGTLCQNL